MSERTPYEQLKVLQREVRERLADLDPELPPLPEPETPAGDGELWLFDSRRGYLEQLEHYKRR